VRLSNVKPAHGAFALLLILWSTSGVFGQITESNNVIRVHKLLLPLAGYTPETGFGFGASAIGQFKMAQNDSLTPYSTLQVTAGITTNGQWMLAAPFDLFFKQRLHHITGEISAQKSKLRFFGVGHLAELQTDERFEALIYRARAQYLKKIDRHLYIGGRWWFEQFNTTQVSEGGLLEKQVIAGVEKHISSGPGLQILIDDRDFINYPEKGHYLEIVMHDQRRHWGSDYAYMRYRFDARVFQKLGRRQVFAAMLFGDFLRGEAPFQQLPQIGSLKRMRGYYEGKFRDHQLLLAQVEERIRLHRLFALHVFGSVAYMNNQQFDLENPGWHAAGGVGIRYFWNQESKTTLRLDMAFGSGKPLFYLAVGEAF